MSANAIVAEQLGVSVGAPLFYVERITFAEDRMPVEFVEFTYAANLYQERLTMRLDRTGNKLSWVPVGPTTAALGQRA
jgi:hypothetical protein